jgi:hypothetical protein
MDGGMPHLHPWDPKPGQTTKVITTPVPGLQVSDLLTTCASQAAHLSVLRSLSQDAGEHGIAIRTLHTGANAMNQNELPPLGTILAYELGRKDFPLPKFLTLGPQVNPMTAHFDHEFQPFLLNSAANPFPNIRRNVDTIRDQERAALLLEQNKEWDSQRQQAEVRQLKAGLVLSERLMTMPLLKAFNFWSDPKELRDRYGSGFGEHCLQARRLVEAGCPFVDVSLGGWARK